jgi:hypothetical protein
MKKPYVFEKYTFNPIEHSVVCVFELYGVMLGDLIDVEKRGDLIVLE